MKYFFTSVFFILIELSTINAQDNKLPITTIEEEILEPLNENSDEETDATNYLEELKYFSENPIDLNTAEKEDFEKLQILTPFQIFSIIDYREKLGSFLSVNELNGVPGISKETFNLLRPFVRISAMVETEKKQRFHQFLLINSGETLEKQKGYNNGDSLNHFEGNPLKLRTKYRIEKGEVFRAGLTAEKDPGEALFSGSNKTFDFLSGFIQIQNTKYLKNLVLGDFIADFGQGLVIWNGFASGESSMTVNTRKVKEGFDKSSSYDENKFLRGVAASTAIGNFDLSVFASSKKIDATIISDSSSEISKVSAIQNSGYHNTSSEIDNEDAIGEIAYGLNATFDKGRMRIGSTLLNVNYSSDFIRSEELYKKHAFSGNNLISAGLNYLLRFRKFELFGEIARNTKKGNAFLNGLAIEVIPEFTMSLVYRYFQSQYYSPYANVFAQNSKATNENGLYSGFEFIPLNGIKINAYCDFFKFPFPKYRVSSPSTGENYFSDIKFDLFKNTSFSFRYSYSKKQEDETAMLSNIQVPEDKYTQKLRFNIAYKTSSSIELRNRVELSYFKKESSTDQTGYLLLQDIIWRPEKLKLTFTGRYAVFETESYETRIYTYENDVLFSNSISALYGKGTRFYAMVKYNFKKLNFWLRYGVTNYSDKEVIGSGLNEISGNKKSDLTLQLTIDL